jgi:acetoacetyl-CoA synthetase
VAASQVMAFMAEANRVTTSALKDYRQLTTWSVENRVRSGTWFGISAAWWERRARARWTARRCRARSSSPTPTEFRREFCSRIRARATPWVFRGEDKVQKRLSWDELNGARFASAAGAEGGGVGAGDRVAAMMPNLPETIAVMLA